MCNIDRDQAQVWYAIGAILPDQPAAQVNITSHLAWNILSAPTNIPAVLYRCLFWEVFSRLRNKLLIHNSYPNNNQIRNGPAIPI